MGDKSFISEDTIVPDVREPKKTTGLYFTLTIIEGRDFGCVFQIERVETVVGRKEKGDQSGDLADIQIDDPVASRRHMMLFKREAVCLLGSQDKPAHVVAVDLGSKNGTFVNGERIADVEFELRNGDKLQIGQTVFKFEVKDILDLSHHERLYQQVTQDALTGLWNHNHAQREMDKLLSMGKRHGWPFSMLLMEIDFFQTLNETYGRAAGDTILRAVSQTIISKLSSHDIAARFKSTKFLTLLPETDLEGAKNVAERLRRAVETIDLSSMGCPQRITFSIGVAQFPVCGETTGELVKQADEALYRAKQTGRNRICVAELLPQKNVRHKALKIAAVILAVLFAISLGISIYPRISGIATGLFQPKELFFSGTIQVREVQVGSKVGGRVKEVLAEEGQMVKAEQPLVRFDISDLLARRSLLEARVKQSEARLAKLENGYRPEEISEAEAEMRKEMAALEALRSGTLPEEIEQAKTDLETNQLDLTGAENNFKRLELLYKSGNLSEQEYDGAGIRKDIAAARLNSSRQKLLLLEKGAKEQIRAAEERYQQTYAKVLLLRSGSRSEDLAEATAQLSEARAELEELNTRVAEGEIKASADSLVEILKVRPGDILPPGKPVAKLLEQDRVWVRVYIPEPELGRISIGQKAAITIDTFPNRIFSGYVEQISGQGEFIPRNVQTRSERNYQVFGVKIHADNRDGVLKSGMAADVKLF